MSGDAGDKSTALYRELGKIRYNVEDIRASVEAIACSDVASSDSLLRYVAVRSLDQLNNVYDKLDQLGAEMNGVLEEACGGIQAESIMKERITGLLARLPEVQDLAGDEKEALGRGNKIEAIKLHRARTGFGLSDSKEGIEIWMSKNGYSEK